MHTNPEVLALVALGEEAGTTAERQHIQTCSACSQEVAELAGIADIGRSSSHPETLLSPSPQVWDRIQSELGFDITETVRTDTVPSDGPSVTSSASVSDLSSRRAGGVPPADTTSGWSIGRRIAALAAAAVLALIVGIGVGINYEQRQFQPETRVIATAQLAPLPQWPGATGTAEITADGRGGRQLILRMTSPEPINGVVQVWLMDPTSTDAPEPMGVMENGVATINIPAGMSLFERPVVDISDEPLDDPDPKGHSGNSILRGELT